MSTQPARRTISETPRRLSIERVEVFGVAVPLVGGDTAVRLAPKSQQDAAINNAEAAEKAMGALTAAIRKLP